MEVSNYNNRSAAHFEWRPLDATTPFADDASHRVQACFGWFTLCLVNIPITTRIARQGTTLPIK
jgi:hypothetical protein